MSGMLHLKSMESISLYGLSDIRLYFDWDSDFVMPRGHSDSGFKSTENSMLKKLGSASTANWRAANRRLAIVVPLALLLIMGVLYAATASC
jgi:Cu/Ag efflux pump CusA